MDNMILVGSSGLLMIIISTVKTNKILEDQQCTFSSKVYRLFEQHSVRVFSFLLFLLQASCVIYLAVSTWLT